jgi:hypothetical protein
MVGEIIHNGWTATRVGLAEEFLRAGRAGEPGFGLGDRLLEAGVVAGHGPLDLPPSRPTVPSVKPAVPPIRGRVGVVLSDGTRLWAHRQEIVPG